MKRNRLLCPIALLALLSPVAGTVASAAPAGAAPVVNSPQPLVDSGSAPDSSAAQLLAGHFGHEVVITSQTTETSLLKAEPNGSFVLESSTLPVRVRHGATWVPVDSNLARTADGLWGPVASPTNIEFSAGGTGPMARIQDRHGQWISMNWPDGTLPTPQISGATARYVGVFPGVDLVLSASVKGMSEVLEIASARAAANPRLASLHFGETGTSFSAATYRNGAAVADDGLHAPAPTWWDASDPGASATSPGLFGTTRSVPISVTKTGFDVNASAPSTAGGIKYPLFVDPDVLDNVINWDYVDNLYPNASNWDQGAGTFMHVGYISDGSGTHVTRSFWQMNLSNVMGTHILGAQFDATDEWSYSCTPEPVTLYMVGPISSTTSWNSQPGTISLQDQQTIAYQNPYFPGGNPGTACPTPSTPTGFNALNAVQTAVAYNWGQVTLGLYTNEANPYYWKQFSDGATIYVNFEHTPSTPGGLAVSPCSFVCSQPVQTGSAQPILTATGTDSDNYNLDYQYQIYNVVNGSPTTIAQSGWTSNVASGGQATWKPTTPLADGNYLYDVEACVNGNSPPDSVCSGWSSWETFAVDTAVPAAPTLTASCAVGPCLSTVASSFSGTVGVTQETVTINWTDPHVYGVAYAIYPGGGSVTLPSNLVCNVTTGGYTTVCPGLGAGSRAVTITAPEQHSTFTAEVFTAAGIASAPASDPTLNFTASGDYTSTAAGHSWLTTKATNLLSASCATKAVPDSATVPLNLTITGSGPTGICWGKDPSAIVASGLLVKPGTNGVLRIGGTSGYASTTAVLDTTANFTVAAWLKPPSTAIPSGTAQTAISQMGVNSSIFYLQDSNNHWSLCVASTDTPTFAGDCVYAPGTVAPGAWEFVAGEYVAADHELLIYTSTSTTIGTAAMASHSSTPRSTGSLLIGEDIIGGVQRYWNGEILDPLAFNGLADLAQLSGLADLQTPVSLVAPVSG